MDVRGKKVLIVGLGLYGGEVATIKWLVKHGAKVVVTDLKNRQQLKKSINSLSAAVRSQVTFVLGRHREADFSSVDIVVQNPAVPSDSRYLSVARNAGIPIINRVCLFLWYCPGKVIGVTGTRGKSTTTSLLYHLLTTGKRKVWIAGLSDKPMMSILDSVKKSDIVVLELSSWMLERTGEHAISPNIAVITNLYPDHLNRYNSMKAYGEAKANIFKFQKATDFAIFNYDNQYTRKMGQSYMGKRIWFSVKSKPSGAAVYVEQRGIVSFIGDRGLVIAQPSDLALPGAHSLENALGAIAVARIFNISQSAIQKSLRSFHGVASRQEVIRVVDGVTYVNDTTATTPDATLAALSVFGRSQKNLVLIAGGAGKAIPYSKYLSLARKMYQYCKAVVMFEGESSELLLRALKEIGATRKNNQLVIAQGITSMRQAVKAAHDLVQSGDTVILSPASASFNMFINEYDRGDQFVSLVTKL